MGKGVSSLRRDRSSGDQVELGEVRQPFYYRYPPKIGSFFGSYFAMAGRRLETVKPETYLFGDNKDVNFLFGQPSPLTSGAPLSGHTCVPMESLVHIQRDSLRIVDCHGDSEFVTVQFTYDSHVACYVTVYCGASESINQGRLNFACHADGCQSESFSCPAGLGQTFSHDELKLPLKNVPESLRSLSFDEAEVYYPLVIVMEASLEGQESHYHVVVATAEECCDGGFSAKIIKQKQMINGILYILQDIFGTTQKENSADDSDDDDSLSGLECELCLTELRDTVILPCRHLCLCHTCAETLRYSSSSCPFCRSPFVALLHVTALQKKPTNKDGYSFVSLLPLLNETTPKRICAASPVMERSDDVTSCQNSANCNSSDLLQVSCQPPACCHESLSEPCTVGSCENVRCLAASPQSDDSSMQQSVFIISQRQQTDALSSDAGDSVEIHVATVEPNAVSPSPPVTANKTAHEVCSLEDQGQGLDAND